jgi:hypothetical protein
MILPKKDATPRWTTIGVTGENGENGVLEPNIVKDS